ncbi:helix-turn-helix domain-containing protein, partial [Rhizobium leguminosarum]|uniref:helix-turn-helix domain-containing protein n=1 Tax=Rhizobium leguminosarum TaxID=384 RepID=UPI003F94C200
SLSLAELAALAGLSLSHLNTQFRNSFGMPPHQYVLHRRLARVEVLIRSSGLPLSQIALEARCRDYPRCSRQAYASDGARALCRYPLG